MKKSYDVSLMLMSLLVFLLAIYGYIQFGYLSLILAIVTILGFLIFQYYKKPILINAVNSIVSIILSIQAFSTVSKLVDGSASCLGPCIGSDLPLLSIRLFSLLVLFISISLFIRRVIEDK